jgi:hypothetical protein
MVFGDSLIFNLDSVKRGLFNSAVYKSFSQRDEIEKDNVKEVICLPNPSITQNMKSANYSKLDKNGIVKEGEYVNENDILIAKVKHTGEKDESGNFIILEYILSTNPYSFRLTYSLLSNIIKLPDSSFSPVCLTFAINISFSLTYSPSFTIPFLSSLE